MKLNRLPRKPCACDSSDSVDRRNQFIDRRAIIAASVAALLAKEFSVPASAETTVAKIQPIIQPQSVNDMGFIQRAFEMRQRAIDLGDQAYGAVVVRDKVIIGQSWSRVVLDEDPTAHAEMAAIRNAARRIGNRNLDGAVMYSSSRPCPMCEASAYWAGIDTLIHGRVGNNAGPPRLCR